MFLLHPDKYSRASKECKAKAEEKFKLFQNKCIDPNYGQERHRQESPRQESPRRDFNFDIGKKLRLYILK